MQTTLRSKMSLPKTFKQAVFKEAGAPLTIEDATMTSPAKGEVLVKVEACGVCFSDMFAQNNILGGGLYVGLHPSKILGERPTEISGLRTGLRRPSCYFVVFWKDRRS